MLRYFIVIFLVGTILSACQRSNVESTEIATAAKTETTVQIEENADSVEQSTSNISPELETLLSYVPQTFADLHLPVFFGPTLYIANIVQIRSDLGISPSIDGASNRKDKLDLIIGLNTQGLLLMPDVINPIDSGNFEQWGWDVADIEQALYLPEFELAVLLGTFERPEIRNSLVEKGYSESREGDFVIFTSDNTEEPHFAWKTDTLIVSASENETKALETLLMNNSITPGLQTHPSVVPMLKHLDGIWGAVFAPSTDWVGFSKSLNIDGWLFLKKQEVDIFQGFLDKKQQTDSLAWDFMMTTYKSDEKETNIRVLYHYPSEAEAMKDLDLVKATLTEAPSVKYRGQRTWGDLLRLESIGVDDTILIVDAHTQNKSLFGEVFESHDYFGLLPIREK